MPVDSGDPGGPEVIEAIDLDLAADARDRTRNVLRENANLSSVSVLDVLCRNMAAPPPPGSSGLMIAMGPAFCSELVLLGWQRVYYLLILTVGVERIVELVVSKRNARWAFAQGGKEFGRKHYPVMVAIHTGLLLGCVLEVWALHRPFLPWLGWPMLALAAATQALRWWCITTLGHRWNTLVIVLPEAPLVRQGPYRWVHHPNYVAVVVEGFALPLIHTAWLTALCFTIANALLLTVRIRVENAALGYSRAV